MPYEHDHAQELPPLNLERPPLIAVGALLAIDRVVLAAGDVPPGILRQFYERVLSLRFMSRDEEGLLFAHSRRQVRLERGREQLGQLGMLVRAFDDALLHLREAGVSYELIHGDGGLTRTVILRDPAGNWVRLVETRDF